MGKGTDVIAQISAGLQQNWMEFIRDKKELEINFIVLQRNGNNKHMLLSQ